MTANERGDLFGRLIDGYVFALGYNRSRFNIHKAGRELDLEAVHRSEDRKIVAEAKATARPVGGADINKFVGSLDAERRQSEHPVTGYFISLAGFRETAVQQELDLPERRLVLATGKDVVNELVGSGLVVRPLDAAQKAGRAATRSKRSLEIDGEPELVAHPLGWIWIIYFKEFEKRCAFALIHASGEPLAVSLAEDVVERDQRLGGFLYEYEYLAPPDIARLGVAALDEARRRYFEYVAQDYGWITLEGLPADQEAGSQRLVLERIFVPLHIEKISAQPVAGGEPGPPTPNAPDATPPRLPVGAVLARAQRVAILAGPGGGKSTLLKRLAVAYAFPERHAAAADKLPERDFFPLVVRCRQLGDSTRSPIVEILKSIPARAELPDITDAFAQLVDRALLSGQALLLIDGLDEIADEGDRMAFVQQLRTFLARYAAVTTVITAREPGFRVVAPALAGACDRYRLSSLDNDDILQLTRAWHHEVVGTSDEIELKASELATRITSNDRIRLLAENPLLLTTLLLVNRWAGELPRRRTTLYGKAIEVLLMTWNVEGHAPIRQDEAVPQLAFVAYEMMLRGAKTITARDLRALLRDARRQMPEILAYTDMSVGDFVRRVEDRSSVLSLSGHGISDGDIVELYEFKHLTFQEYLAAVALVEGFYREAGDQADLASLLAERLEDSDWSEVVPIAAVLAGRRAASLVEGLIDRVRRWQPHPRLDVLDDPASLPHAALTQCLADEVQLAPSLARLACDWSARKLRYGRTAIGEQILSGRYGPMFRETTERGFMSPRSVEGYAAAFTTIVDYDAALEPAPPRGVRARISMRLASSEPLECAYGAVELMMIAFERPGRRTPATLDALGDDVVPLLFDERPTLQFSACWALAWLGAHGFWHPARRPDVLDRLFGLWRNTARGRSLRDWAAWALSELPLLSREMRPLGAPTPDTDRFLRSEVRQLRRNTLFRLDRGPAALVAGYYLGSPWSDEEIMNQIDVEVESRFTARERLYDALSD
jgi:hypothetical protein